MFSNLEVSEKKSEIIEFKGTNLRHSEIESEIINLKLKKIFDHWFKSGRFKFWYYFLSLILIYCFDITVWFDFRFILSMCDLYSQHYLMSLYPGKNYLINLSHIFLNQWSRLLLYYKLIDLHHSKRAESIMLYSTLCTPFLLYALSYGMFFRQINIWLALVLVLERMSNTGTVTGHGGPEVVHTAEWWWWRLHYNNLAQWH